MLSWGKNRLTCTKKKTAEAQKDRSTFFSPTRYPYKHQALKYTQQNEFTHSFMLSFNMSRGSEIWPHGYLTGKRTRTSIYAMCKCFWPIISICLRCWHDYSYIQVAKRPILALSINYTSSGINSCDIAMQLVCKCMLVYRGVGTFIVYKLFNHFSMRGKMY